MVEDSADAKAFQQSIEIRLQDIDAAGVMFFAHYFDKAHSVYEAFMRHIGFPLPELIGQGRLLPLVGTSAEFFHPVRHGDRLAVELRVERVGKTSFTLDYAFLTWDGAEAARLRTSHVLLNAARETQALPPDLRLILTEYNAATESD